MNLPVTNKITREMVQSGEQLELRPPRIEGRVKLSEFWASSGDRYGDLSGTQLSSIRKRLARGEVAEWADLCEFWLSSDDGLASLYSTRLDRIMEREWEVIPNDFGDPGLAQLSAEMCHELIGKIENWDAAIRGVAHAIAPGFSANESEWDHDRVGRCHFVRKIHHRHGHRFRFGPTWTLRLYDKGQVRGPDGYGDVLRPDLWIVHHHQEQAGYPWVGGVMLACSWQNMFVRWVEKMRMGGLERYGSAIPVLTKNGDTPLETREEALSKLQDMASDHAFVVEAPDKLELLAPSGGSGGNTSYKEKLDDAYASRARLWLGSSDVADPGEHGSQAAVGQRVEATTDPKTVADRKNIANTLHHTLLKYLVRYNAAKLGAPASEIPVPKLKAWTDAEDKAEQAAQQQQRSFTPGYLPNGQPAPTVDPIQLARERDPKAAASGEPRRAKLVVGRAAKRSPTLSTSLATRIAQLAHAE